MKIQLTEQQPPTIKITAESTNELRGLMAAADLLRGRSAQAEAIGLVPGVSSRTAKSLLEDMSQNSSGPSERSTHLTEHTFETSNGHSKTLLAAGILALEEVTVPALREDLVRGDFARRTNRAANTETQDALDAFEAWTTRVEQFTQIDAAAEHHLMNQ